MSKRLVLNKLSNQKKLSQEFGDWFSSSEGHKVIAEKLKKTELFLAELQEKRQISEEMLRLRITI
jgi:hypothetical protein